MAKALSCGVEPDIYSDPELDISNLKELEEIKLIKILTLFPEIIKKVQNFKSPCDFYISYDSCLCFSWIL